MDILKPLSEDQEEAASRLDSRQLCFANMWLTMDQHGMTAGECYRRSGYNVVSDETANVNASRTIRNARIERYIRAMRGESIKRVGLTLEYLDEQLREILEGNVADINNADINALPPEIQRTIHQVKDTRDGREIKQYSRLEALRLAYQRQGALTDRKELTGAGGGPIETKELSDTELNARIQRLVNDVTDTAD